MLVAKGVSDDNLADFGRADRRHLEKTYDLSRLQAKNIKELCRPAAIADGWLKGDVLADTSGPRETSSLQDKIFLACRPNLLIPKISYI